MHFNIIVGNHGELETLEPLAPLVNYVRSTLSVCGHSAAIVQQGLHSSAINLFLEHFPDVDSWLPRLRTLKQKHGLRIGVIATELMVGNTIPYARNGIYTVGPLAKDEYIERRVAGFNAVLPEVDFLWSFFRRTADEYKSRCKRSWYFPVGHVHSHPPELRTCVKDIDIAFFGTMTPHRLAILRQFARIGSLNTAFVGRQPDPGATTGIASSGFAPSYMLSSILDRARIGLNLTLCSADEADRGIDPRFASCTRVTEMLEHDVCIVSEEIPHDNPYRDYMVSAEAADLAEVCLELIQSGEWRSRGPDCGSRFRDKMDVRKICAPVIEETLDALAAPG
jgi:hypothetical protein